MRESISYTFLLNIIITFVFVCFAIIMGIFSYFRAFKANNIIINEIEKYEGFNCLSQASIQQKLQTIAYNVPFEASCSAFSGERCMYDNEKNYAVISYNIEHERMYFVNDEDMNSQYLCSDATHCEQTKNYQYGVYTYMYVDLPILSKLIKLKVYGKTNLMTEYRTFIENGSGTILDANYIPNEIREKSKDATAKADRIARLNELLERWGYDEANYEFWHEVEGYLTQEEYLELYYGDTKTDENLKDTDPASLFGHELLSIYAKGSVGLPTIISSDGVTSRTLFQYDPDQTGVFDGRDATYVISEDAYKFECGRVRDYNRYRR